MGQAPGKPQIFYFEAKKLIFSTKTPLAANVNDD